MDNNKYKIDIQSILSLVSVKFVVIKKSPIYPDYEIGNDIDIFCQDKNEMARQIQHLAYNLVDQGYKISVCEEDGHIHIDFIKDKLIIRIDLIDSLDVYKELVLSDSEYAELAIRLLEYGVYPNKTKHLDYVKSHLL